MKSGSAQQGVDHHANAMSGHFRSNARHHPPGTLRVVLGQVQLLLQLGIDRFAQQTEAVKLCLSRLGADGNLSFFDWCEQFQRVLLFQVALQSCIIVGSVPQQVREVMGKRVQQFDDGLIVVAIGWGKKETQNDAAQTNHCVDFAAKVFHGLAAANSIASRADKITALLAALVAL